MAKHLFSVTLPIAGHAYIDIEADSEEEAINKAMDTVTVDHIESWEALTEVNRGNFCHFPTPWEAEAEDLGPAEDEAAT